MNDIKELLLEASESKYRDFSSSLLPNIDKDKVIGVKVPKIRALLKYVNQDFINTLPHTYHEENQLHMMYVCSIKDFDQCVGAVNCFLPYVNNWAVSDCKCPKCFKSNPDKLLPYVKQWINSSHAYTVRFAIKMFMDVYLEEYFDSEYLRLVVTKCRDHKTVADDNYYVNMMISWYFATALAKQWDKTYAFMQQNLLNEWCLKKTVQKARESYRISDEHKTLLKKLLN